MTTGDERRSGSRRITYPHEVIRQDRPLTRSTGRLAHRAGVVAFVLVTLVIVVAFLHIDAGNPPGSYRDGPATYRGHVGEKPMAITWELHHPLPGDLCAQFAAAVA
jgi:hypothetical protein